MYSQDGATPDMLRRGPYGEKTTLTSWDGWLPVIASEHRALGNTGFGSGCWRGPGNC